MTGARYAIFVWYRPDDMPTPQWWDIRANAAAAAESKTHDQGVCRVVLAHYTPDYGFDLIDEFVRP